MPHRMYSDLADWWRLLSPVQEYAEEAELFKKLIASYAAASPRTLLELGAGGGNNAYHLKASFDMTLVDLAENMLNQSREINGALPHHLGDLRDVRLGGEYDAVFIHDAIDYMVSRADLERAMSTAWVHCRRGGVALFVPDHTKERFTAETSSGGVDEGARGMRYLEWMWDPNPDDDTCITDYAYLLRDEAGAIDVVHDRHEHGLFHRHVWLETMATVGFEPHTQICEHSDVPAGIEVFVGTKS